MQSPTVQRFLHTVDNGARFMTQAQYHSANPAMAATRSPLVAGLWVMLAFAGVTFIWGILAPIESAAVAKGQVSLLLNKKTVQHLEGGIIEEILVKEGALVEKSQPLIRLNAKSANANSDILQSDYWSARATEARLLAQRDKLDAVVFPPELAEAAKGEPELAKILEAQVRLFISQRGSHQAKIGALQQRIAQSEEMIKGLEAQIAGADQQMRLVKEEADTVEGLLKKGYATKPRLLALLRTQEELRANRGQQAAEIAKARQAITETQMQILNEENEYEAKNSEALRDTHLLTTSTTEKLGAAQDVTSRTMILAPAAGIVHGLKHHTVGGVIQPGMPIMDVIPQDDQLIVEARVQPPDIDVVHAGMEAKVVLLAYKMRSMPKLPGKVIQISADKFTDETVPSNTYYLARIEVDKSLLKDPVDLYPGMPVDVLIRTGSRSFLGYLFQPITDSLHRAFREE